MIRILCTLLSCEALLLTGCTARFVDFTVISTKNVDLSRAGTFQRGSTRSQGIDKVSIIIFIPTGVANLKEAIDRAIEAVPGAVALLDGVVTTSSWYFIYGEQQYAVEGTPLIDPALKTAGEQATTPYIIAAVNKAGQVTSLTYVTKNEFETIRKKAAAAGTRLHS